MKAAVTLGVEVELEDGLVLNLRLIRLRRRWLVALLRLLCNRLFRELKFTCLAVLEDHPHHHLTLRAKFPILMVRAFEVGANRPERVMSVIHPPCKRTEDVS